MTRLQQFGKHKSACHTALGIKNWPTASLISHYIRSVMQTRTTGVFLGGRINSNSFTQSKTICRYFLMRAECYNHSSESPEMVESVIFNGGGAPFSEHLATRIFYRDIWHP